MKRFYFLSVFTLVCGLVGLFGMDASAQLKGHRVTNLGNAKATGGNGGKAEGKGTKGGNGGKADAKGGSIQNNKKGRVQNSGNADAKGGNGGDAKGDGAVGGAGGSANAQGGNIGTPPKKTTPIDPGKGNGKPPVDPGFPKGGNVKKDPKGPKKGGDVVADGKGKGKKDEPKAGGGGGGKAEAGGAKAEGGKGGDATGKGATGGAGGAATAINGDGNTVINGNVIVNNNITYTPGRGKGGKGKGGSGMGSGGMGGGFGSFLSNVFSGGLGGGAGGGGGGGGFGGDTGPSFPQASSTDDGIVTQGAQGQAIASSPGETVITNDGSPAVAQGTDGKNNVENAEAEQIFTRRYLKVKNTSGVAMKVHVQYRGQDDKKWAWLPADPSESKDALIFELEAGQEMFLQDKGSKLSASRVRIWAVAGSQTWSDFRDEDLWIVPEMDQRGEHRYQATEMRTFTFVFPKLENTESK